MTIRLAVRLLLSGALLLALPAAAAAADFLVEPFLAWSRSPATEGSATDTGAWHPGGGVGVNWLAGSLVAGAEIGYASAFFDPSQPASDLIQSSHLLTVSGTVGVSRRLAGEHRILPYATGGAGLMRQQARDREGLINVTRNDPAINMGGGTRIFVTRYIGLGGDLRYFVNLKKPFDQPTDLTSGIGRLTFWRVTAFAVLQFGD